MSNQYNFVRRSGGRLFNTTETLKELLSVGIQFHLHLDLEHGCRLCRDDLTLKLQHHRAHFQEPIEPGPCSQNVHHGRLGWRSSSCCKRGGKLAAMFQSAPPSPSKSTFTHVSLCQSSLTILPFMPLSHPRSKEHEPNE